MLIPTLIITQPGWLAAALIGAAGLAAALRPADRRIRLAHTALSLIAALAVATLLLLIGGSNAHVLLGLAALGAGLWLLIEFARRQTPQLSLGRQATLILVRLCAWLVVLTIIAQPACDRRVTVYEKPVLAIVLDDSASLGIVDGAATTQPAPSGPTRAALANRALASVGRQRRRLADLYDLRVRRIDGTSAAPDDWTIAPKAPATAIADALRAVRELRSAHGEPPAAVLLISDGAENVADKAAVRDAADALNRQGTALLAIGVGPPPGETPMIEFRPLNVPPRIGLRDMLHVAVEARVSGCDGQVLPVQMLWNDTVADSTSLPILTPVQLIGPAFDLLPPGAGLQRLTARIAVTTPQGDQTFTTSAVVDVVGERTQVLVVERVPRGETAAVLRALRGDENMEVTPRLLLGNAASATDLPAADWWAGYDVVILGRVRDRVPADALASLADAVTTRGVGLLLAGGREMFRDGIIQHTPLEDVCPVLPTTRLTEPIETATFTPTPAGLRNPALAGVASGPDEAATWAALPPLGPVATLGPPKLAAVVLATDAADRPLLVAQTVGRGRVIAAAWESTWPWALESDEGRALQQRLWQQMVGWLANRRPRAWVVTDDIQYPVATLAGGQRRVQIRAGVTGLDSLAPTARPPLVATLKLKRSGDAAGDWENVPLRRSGDEWVAEWPVPADRSAGSALAPGRVELEFTARQPTGATASDVGKFALPEDLTARTRFEIVAENVELRAPTADLALLRSAAERTADAGGRYIDLDRLPAALDELAQHDRRRAVERVRRYEIVAREPWGLLAWLALALAVEWGLRKRSGLA